MSDSTVPNLTAATALTGTELFYVVQGGNDRKATTTQIQTFIGSGVTIGTTVITGGTTGRLLYDNAGIVGEALLTYSAAQLQLGAADAAAPVAQTLGVQNVTGAVNTAGVDWTINASRGTGTGAGGRFIFQTAAAGASGSSQNALVAALTLDSSQNATIGGTSLTVGGSLLQSFGGGVTLGYAANFQLGSSRQISWSSGAIGGANDLILTHAATATLQLGNTDAASPVAQVLQVQNVAAGNSNLNGANWTLNGSLSTGTGTSGDIIFQTGGTGAGATSQNALVTAMTVKGATQQVILATNLRINVTPTANTSASTTITNGADSSSNLGHRLSFNFNGTTYWIPCGSTAF